MRCDAEQGCWDAGELEKYYAGATQGDVYGMIVPVYTCCHFPCGLPCTFLFNPVTSHGQHSHGRCWCWTTSCSLRPWRSCRFSSFRATCAPSCACLWVFLRLLVGLPASACGPSCACWPMLYLIIAALFDVAVAQFCAQLYIVDCDQDRWYTPPLPHSCHGGIATQCRFLVQQSSQSRVSGLIPSRWLLVATLVPGEFKYGCDIWHTNEVFCGHVYICAKGNGYHVLNLSLAHHVPMA